MPNFSPLEILIFMSSALFLSGLGTLIAGVLVLILRSGNQDLNSLAVQTSQLVKKGFAEDVAGLVGNASALLGAMTELSRTQRGIGIILIIVGMLLMIGGCALVLYINSGQGMS